MISWVYSLFSKYWVPNLCQSVQVQQIQWLKTTKMKKTKQSVAIFWIVVCRYVWGSKWGLRICMSETFSGNVDFSGPGSTTLWSIDMRNWEHLEVTFEMRFEKWVGGNYGKRRGVDFPVSLRNNTHRESIKGLAAKFKK